MEARDLVLTGKPFAAQKYNERTRPAIGESWLPTRVTFPNATHEPARSNTIITSAGRRSKDRTSVRNRSRPHSASVHVPGRKPISFTRPSTGLAAPGDHTALYNTRDAKHSGRIDLTTLMNNSAHLFTTTSEPNFVSCSKSISNDSEPHKCDSKLSCSDVGVVFRHKGNSNHGDDIQTLSAITIQRWFRKLKANKLDSSQQLVQGILQQKKDDLNKSRIAELEKAEAHAREMCRVEVDQQKRRAVKAQKARQAAIESLRLKREERKQEIKRIAQQEMLMLQSSGKVARKKVARPESKPSGQKSSSSTKAVGDSATSPSASSSNLGASPGDKIGDSPATLPPEVEQFFEANSQPQRLLRSPAPQTGGAKRTVSTHDHVTTGAGHGKETNTYDDLLDTLKLLEEDPEPLKQSAEKGYLSAANLYKLDQTSVGANGIASSDAVNDTVTSKANPVGLNETKMQGILSFLDEMEKVDGETASQLSLSEEQHRTVGLPSNAFTGKSNNTVEVAEAVAADVTTTIMAQRLELEDKNKSILMLQKALAQQREMTVYHSKEHEKEGERRLALQKQEYESTIQRHLSFIDQLIDDKKVLSEKCEKLVKEVKELDKKCSQKVKALEEKHTLELTKQKEVVVATEKLRRERWVAEHSKRIKEMTVKGLEPEIQRLIAKHKAEVQKIKVLHEADLLQADEKASRRFIRQTEEQRAQLSAEKEAACAHERELAKQRYEKMAEQEEMANQQQRKRLYQEVQLEKERLAGSFQQQQRELEQRFANVEVSSNTAVAELKTGHEKTLAEMQRRHMSELKDLREKLQIEKEAWEENFMKKQYAVLVGKQRELQEQLRKQRDKEIEMVISRLEEESTAAREECDRNAEARIKRIRDKYETELKEVERSERSTLEKFNTMKEELVVAQGEMTRLRSLFRQKENDMEQVNEVVAKLNHERDNISDVVRQEFADRLVFTEEENKSLKTELSELRARQKLELDRVHKDKDKEMERVHERVKQAVAKKDEAMKSLRAQHEAALKRADHLEMLLERQRQELLKK